MHPSPIKKLVANQSPSSCRQTHADNQTSSGASGISSMVSYSCLAPDFPSVQAKPAAMLLRKRRSDTVSVSIVQRDVD